MINVLTNNIGSNWLCNNRNQYQVQPPWMMASKQVISVYFSCSFVSDSLQPHGLQHARFPCPSPTPEASSNSCPVSQWCHPIISSSVFPSSCCLQSFPESESFPISQFFTSSGPSIGSSASVSVLPMNIQDWFPLGLAGLISLRSKGRYEKAKSKPWSTYAVAKEELMGAGCVVKWFNVLWDLPWKWQLESLIYNTKSIASSYRVV